MNRAGPVHSIVIVGGGTAGWLSAAYLQRALGTAVQITLVESSATPPIGVGESTLPTLGPTLAFLGLEESEWMPRVGATYKCGIRFTDWAHAPNTSQRRSFWHPFTARPEPMVLPYERPYYPQVGQGFGLLHYALKQRLDGSSETLAELISPTPELCERRLSPRSLQGPDLPIPPAYHVDAGRLGLLLREKAVERGVRHVVDQVTGVTRDADGFVTHVATATSGELEGDFFVDCSGFRGLLINQTLEEPFIDYGSHLLCDSAIAMPRDNDAETDGIEPYTTATALRHGWCWNVPLFHRYGCGYVFSSAFVSSDDAEQELRDFLGPSAKGAEARHLKMRVGRTRSPWVKNVVAIGLSAGFLEPLEATGIFLIEYGLATLLNLFPHRDCAPARASLYNGAMQDVYEQVLDFVVLHYWSSHRTDSPFWNAARSEGTLPPTLRARLDFLHEGLPVLDSLELTVFQAYSYACILDGFDRLPQREHPMLEHIGYDAGFTEMARRRATHRDILRQLPDHYQMLRAMYDAAGQPA